MVYTSPSRFGCSTPLRMHKFLDHLDTFIDNGHEGDTFDGDNHAAMFLVREKNFEGKARTVKNGEMRQLEAS